MRFYSILCALAFALMSGFFFAFSAAVLPGLIALPRESGMLAMQSINSATGNTLYASAFWVSFALAAFGAILALTMKPRGWFLLFLGCVIYLIGAFLTTIWGSIPANREIENLAPTAPAAAIAWTNYQAHWATLNLTRAGAALIGALIVLLPLLMSPAQNRYR